MFARFTATALALAAVLSLVSTADACTRCGLFGRNCRFASIAHEQVVVAPIAASPEVLVVQNNLPAAPAGYSAPLLAPQGPTVYGYQASAAAYYADPAEMLRQSSDLAKGVQQLMQSALDAHKETSQLAIEAQTVQNDSLNRALAAAAILQAAGLNQPQQQSQALRIYKDGAGNWQVESAEPQAVNAKVQAFSAKISSSATKGGGAVTPPAQAETAGPAGVSPSLPGKSLLAAKCAKCHGTDKQQPAAGLYFDAGVALDCDTLEKANADVLDGKMPKGSSLTDAEKLAVLSELKVLRAATAASNPSP